MITPPTTAAAALAQVEHRLSLQSHWTQGTMARSADKFPCEVDACSARCWCLDGALLLTSGNVDTSQAYNSAAHLLRRAAYELYGYGSYVEFNDAPATTHDMVLAVVRRARELAN